MSRSLSTFSQHVKFGHVFPDFDKGEGIAYVVEDGAYLFAETGGMNVTQLKLQFALGGCPVARITVFGNVCLLAFRDGTVAKSAYERVLLNYVTPSKWMEAQIPNVDEIDQCISDASAYVSRLRRLPATDGVTARIVSEEMNIRVMERKKFLHSPQKLREAVLLNELQENYQRWPAHVARSIETITADYGEGAPYLFDLARNYCIVYRGGELVAAAKNTSVFLERHGDDEGYFFEDGFDEQHKKATVSVDAYNTKQFRTIQSFKV